MRQLEYLVALAREQHFGRAAAACFVSQPSLSAGIRKLEGELGVPLIRRGIRYQGLTAEGEHVLMWAHRMLGEHATLRHELASLKGELNGTLRLGAIPTALTVASLITTPFCARHPAAKVSLESLPSRDITRRLTGLEIDAALTYLDDSTLRDVQRFPLYEERYVLLTPADGPLAEDAEVSWARAAALPLCLLAPRMRNRRILDENFAAEGARADPAIESDTVAGLYAHLAAGPWSSVVSHAWLHVFGVPEGKRVVRLTGPAHGPRVGLAVIGRHPQPLIVRALLTVARGAGVRESLDALLHRHLGS
ncbi:LysR family transcriptional regulator [Streptomyces kanamyceticus]|uniref:LysR family transcriptional regulator n=1 Tax=Streptomyces kanamyceticus TaxID=1967 RepID=A0A5J6GPW9_STRKN|nr:LysR family transcriptional regulator [Streptomyces kanamyceticus]